MMPPPYSHRLSRLEGDLQRLWDAKADDKDVIRINDEVKRLDKVKADRDRIDELRSDMQSVRKALYAVAGGVVVGAILFTLALAQGLQ